MMKRLFSILAAMGLLATPALAGVVLTGPDSQDGTYSLSALSAAATAGDTVSSGGLTGISLWGFLAGAAASSPASPGYGGITTSTPAGDNGKNAILRYFLVGTSSTGQQSVVSLGEIDPAFGNASAFVAYQGTGLTAPALVVPGSPGRTLNNLVSLQLLSVPAIASIGGGVSTAVQLSGNVSNPGSYTQAVLQTAFTPVNEVVGTDTYTGVPLATFLGVNNADTNAQIVVAQATDGYEAVYALAELEDNASDLLPYGDTAGNFPGDGVARTLLPGDVKQGRWVSNLDALSVQLAVPEPASMALLAGGLLAMALVTPRRRRISKG